MTIQTLDLNKPPKPLNEYSSDKNKMNAQRKKSMAMNKKAGA